MDGTDLKKKFEERKAAADKVLQERQQKQAEQRRLFDVKFEALKARAAVRHTLRKLESPEVKALKSINKRPAEKLVRNKTKGLKKGKGLSGPGL